MLRRLLACCGGVREPKRKLRGEGEAFLHLTEEVDESRRAGTEALHPGLDAAFKHVEKLEANMRKGGR